MRQRRARLGRRHERIEARVGHRQSHVISSSPSPPTPSIPTIPPSSPPASMATSPACVVQAMQWGPRAHSAQFHLEVEADTVDTWAAIPAYARALEQALGRDGARGQ